MNPHDEPSVGKHIIALEENKKYKIRVRELDNPNVIKVELIGKYKWYDGKTEACVFELDEMPQEVIRNTAVSEGEFNNVFLYFNNVFKQSNTQTVLDETEKTKYIEIPFELFNKTQIGIAKIAKKGGSKKRRRTRKSRRSKRSKRSRR